MSFQTEIISLMELGNLSVKDVAKACGVSQSTVKRWILGEGAPHAAMREPFTRLLHDFIQDRPVKGICI